MKFQDIGKKELLELGLGNIKGYAPLRDLAKMTNDKFQIWEVNSEQGLMIFPVIFINTSGGKKLCMNPHEYCEIIKDEIRWFSVLNPQGFFKSKNYSYKELDTDYFKLISEVDFANLPEEYVNSCCNGLKQQAKILWLQKYFKGEVSPPYIEEDDKSLQEALAKQAIDEKDAKIRSLNAKISKLMGEKEELLNVIKEKEHEIRDYRKLFLKITKIKENLHVLLDDIDDMI